MPNKSPLRSLSLVAALCSLALGATLPVVGCSASSKAAPAASPGGGAERGGTEAPEAFTRITLAELASRVEKHEAMALFDANMRDRYERGHIPGAKWVDVATFGAADLPADKATPLVFYCFNPQCTASHQAATRASQLGHANVSVMPEGILAWEKAGKPIEPSAR